MPLHLLLFTSDAHIALILGKLMSEFEIEVEFCSDAVASVEKVTQDKFDALVVDWDDGPEASFLLRTARELKSTRECVVLALVSDPAAAACAVQMGAHGILNKPIVPEQVRESVGTIRDMLSPRPSSHKAASAPDASHVAAKTAISPAVGPVEESDNAESDPAVGEQSTANRRKLKFLAREPRELPPLPPMPSDPAPVLQEASVGTIFTSTPYLEEPAERKVLVRKKKGGKPDTRIVVMAGLLFAAAALYVWAPGSSYFDRLTAAARSLVQRKEPDKVVVEAKPSPSTEQATKIDVAANSSSQAEPIAPLDTEDSSNIQVTPVTEPTDMNTGAPRPFRPTGPVGVKMTDESQASASQASVGQISVTPPSATPVSSFQSPAAGPAAVDAPVSAPSTAPPAHPLRAIPPSMIAAVDHPSTDVPQSLRVSNPINPVQAAVPSSPPMASGSSLTPTIIPEETSRELLVKKVPPLYPEQAIHSGVQGVVVLQAWIAKDGTVRDVKLLRGSFVLARAAVDAVRQWQYKPYVLNGQATEVQTTITVGFKLPTAVVNLGAPSDSPKP